MAGATVGSVFPGANASPPIMPRLPWQLPLVNAPEPARFVPVVASRSAPGFIGRDPVMRRSGLGSEAMGLTSGAAEGLGPLTPGHLYTIEGPLPPGVAVGSSLSGVMASLSGGGAWHIEDANSPSGTGFIIHATYTGPPVADATLPSGWTLSGTGLEGATMAGPPPVPPPASNPVPPHLVNFLPHLTNANPPATTTFAPTTPEPQAPLGPPPTLDTSSAPTSGGGGGGGDSMGTPLLVAGGVVLAFLYFGRKKKRGR
jgi:hypothetical protein